MRILIGTDAFPPRCGGSGWSTFELAQGLRARGHEILVVQPRPGQAADGSREYEGFTVQEIASPAPAAPFVRNYFKNERLWPRLSGVLRELIGRHGIDIVHAQHVLTAPAAVSAGAATGVPTVCTVRDYWPVCYWGTLIYDTRAPDLCPACTPGMMARCVRPRAGAAWPAALPFIPYMRGNLERKRRSLSRASAIIAVSSAIGRDLRQRAPELAGTRLEVIPNPVDVAGIRASGEVGRVRLHESYAVYLGKLEANKGAALLLPAVERARLAWPLVVIGDGALRAGMEADARRLGKPVRFTGWLPRDEALAWLAGAAMLIFPSFGPESLSRVLLEAGALGIPTAAMDTGGTTDIVRHEVTGLLSHSPEELGDHVARLVADRALAERLGQAARAHVAATFDAPGVVARVEALYRDLLAGAPGAEAR